ncbi:MAG: hypothetical protein ACI4PO_07370 [Faecousia sp.]
MDEFRRYMVGLNDGTMDVDAFLATGAGKKLVRRLMIRTHTQYDWDTAEQYYASLGLHAEFHDPEDYYARWKLFIPTELEQGVRYPILFWLHGGGNSIEGEEAMTGYLQLAGREKFLFVLLQNTNEEKVLAVLEDVKARYPVDTGRVYLAGFSQGAQQVIQCMTHHPDTVTAIAVTGTDIWRPWDNFDHVYTKAQLETLKELVVPMSLHVNNCEPFAYAPLNFWHPNQFNQVSPEGKGLPDTFAHPGRIQDQDPTRITEPGKGRYDPNNPYASRMASKYIPREGEDISAWAVECVNKRLTHLQCALLDVSVCISYLTNTADELHHAVGIYGDWEEIRYIDGSKHYIVSIDNQHGIPAFQYVLTENLCHWPAPSAGELGWAFLKRFRWDRETHQIVFNDSYCFGEK